jgi:hypothetical protein
VARLEPHFNYLRAAIAEARAAPLAIRKARLAIALLDAYVDRLYAADTSRAEDILTFRTGLSHTSPSLALLLAVAEQKPGAPQLHLETAPLSPSDYSHLSEAEFMVSLYNDATMPKLLIIAPDNASFDAHSVLQDAFEHIRAVETAYHS